MTPEQVDQMTAEQMRAALHHVVRLCNSYAAGPPPIFQGPGLSEHGKGYNAGTGDMACAVLSTLAGEPSEDQGCTSKCPEPPAPKRDTSWVARAAEGLDFNDDRPVRRGYGGENARWLP